MSEGLTLAGFAAMFRLGPEKITMTKADAVRLAEVAQVASDEITRLRAKNARLREALARAKDLFLQGEPQKAFIEVCAALGETQ